MATQSDLRTLRRWILVAGVWAVAATAVALIALLDTSGDDAQKATRDAAGRNDALDRRQDQLSGRVDALDTKVGDLAPSGDVSKLEDRLGRAEADASAAKKDAKQAGDTLTELEDRVGEISDDAPSPKDEKESGDPGAAEPPP